MIGSLWSEFWAALARVREVPAESVGDWNTSGEPDDEEPSEWDGGRLTWARWVPCHSGRVGRAIRPWAVVVHTTDMAPGSFDALVKAWASRPGAGNAAHFLVGRTETDGTVQMIDCARNGNHAGGKPAHGWFTAGGQRIHPNSVSIGIEVHNAGEVRLIAGQWRTGEYDNGWHPHGAPLDPADVIVDDRNKSRGLHRPTEWQLEELARLLEALGHCPVIAPYPEGWGIAANGAPQSWAPQTMISGLPVVGHVTLDPARKGDPHKAISRWLASR